MTLFLALVLFWSIDLSVYLLSFFVPAPYKHAHILSTPFLSFSFSIILCALSFTHTLSLSFLLSLTDLQTLSHLFSFTLFLACSSNSLCPFPFLSHSFPFSLSRVRFALAFALVRTCFLSRFLSEGSFLGISLCLYSSLFCFLSIALSLWLAVALCLKQKEKEL